MSWFSRSGGWGGRFSPFGRPGSSNDNEVSEDNYSYITDQDLAEATGKFRPRVTSRANRTQIVDWDDKNPERDTDVLIFKNGRTNYPTHFPVHTIRDGDLKIGTVRQAAAKKLDVDDARRIRMFYKGRNLKHDDRTAREEGLRGDGSGSEILCVIGEAQVGSMAPGLEPIGIPGDTQRAWSEGSDEEDNSDVSDSGSGVPTKKKPRKRGGRKNRKGKKSSDASANVSRTNLGYSNSNATGAEFLPIPSHLNAGPRPSSASPAPSPKPSAPQTPIGKLDAIASKFHTELVPLCVTYMNNPPEDKAKRDFEYKKLSETILAQVLLKLDGVETEGDPDARARRKELVREVQNMLHRLDDVVK
ncbi:BAG domain-containing protein [Lojkania enalia]|uniref:BAG domain-containing protein n=1 Tax=Lojkania enalia TaxID=147567 RepID=A0A9P4KA45_9PLEO|nr:BAG domain-containing protein [Didymosphaeria enalia]